MIEREILQPVFLPACSVKLLLRAIRRVAGLNILVKHS